MIKRLLGPGNAIGLGVRAAGITYALAFAMGCSTDPQEGSSSSSAEPEDQEVFAIGEKAHTGDFDVVVHQATDPWTSTNQFDTPQAGHRFVAVEVEVTNTGAEAQTISSLLGAELTDSMNRPWDAALAGVGLPSLDGEVQPGQARRGWMVFDVASDATGLTLRLKGNLTATGSLFKLG